MLSVRMLRTDALHEPLFCAFELVQLLLCAFDKRPLTFAQNDLIFFHAV